MGGGDLNLKKSWHPLTLRNLEKVWKAEQASEKEKQKLEQLRKEKRQEQELEDLQRLQESSTKRKNVEKLDWMYAGSTNSATASASEEYLLGKRRVDEFFRNEKSVSAPLNKDKNHTILRDDSAALEKDLGKKIREDPLFAIKQQASRQLKKKLVKRK